MTDANLIAETRRLESEAKKFATTQRKVLNENKQLDARIKEN